MSKERGDVDWRLPTWEGSRRAQLRQGLTLTLRERLEAVEGMAEVARRFQEMRAEGKFKAANDHNESGSGAAPRNIGKQQVDQDKGRS